MKKYIQIFLYLVFIQGFPKNYFYLNSGIIIAY